MKVSSSIGFKINLAFGTALVLSVAILTTVGTLNVRHQAINEFEQSSRARITQADGSLDGTFSEVEQNLTYLAQTPELMSADATITNYLTHTGKMTPDSNGGVEQRIFTVLRQFGDAHPDMRYLDIGTHWGGYVQWPMETMNGDHYDPRQRPWYIAAMESPGRVARPAPYLSAAGSGGAIIPFARVIRNAGGEVLGALEGDLSLEGFAKLTSDIHFGQSGYLIVTDNNGRVLIDPRDKRHEFKEFKSLGDGYAQLASAADGRTAVTIDSTPYQAYAYTSPKNGWRYYALEPEAEMMAAANRLTFQLVGTGALVIVVALLAMVVLSRQIAVPLRTLAGSMHEIAVGDGDLTRRLPIVNNDEVGLLAGRFNAFVEKLHGVLVKVSSSISHLETASREVSAGNNDLPART